MNNVRPASETAPGAAPSSLLRNPSFLLLTQACLINQAGSQIAFVATAYWLRTLTNSASLIGLLATTAAVPILLLGPVGGSAADRWERRRILILCDIGCGLLCLLLMLLSGPIHIGSGVAVAGVYLCTLLLACSTAFTNPALNAIVPDIVARDQVERAVGYTQALSLMAIVLGQAAGAFLLARFSPAVLFAVDGATYGASAIAECFLRSRFVPVVLPEPLSAIARLRHDVIEMKGYVWKRPGLRVLLMAALPVSLFTDPILVFLPFYTTGTLGEPLSRYAYLLSVFSIGLFLGYVLAGIARLPAERRYAVLIAAIAGNAICCILLCIVHSFLFAALLLLVFGCLSGTITLHSVNALLSQTEPDRRGRIIAVLLMITQGLTPLAMSLFGVAGDMLHRSIQPIYGGCGLGLLITAGLCSRSQGLRLFLTGTGAEASGTTETMKQSP